MCSCYDGENGDTTYPTPTADMKVPKKANVKMEPKFRKKFSFQGCESDSTEVNCDQLTCFNS